MPTQLASSIALSAALLTASVALLARPVDPTLPVHIVVGSPAGPAPMDRLTPTRSGRTRTELPRSPQVKWRARVPGKPVNQLVVDSRGAIVVSTTTHLSQISRLGKVQWSLRLAATSGAGPVITSGGSRWAVTPDAEIVSVDDAGRIEWRHELPTTGGDLPGALLPTPDGGCVVPVGKEVFRLERDGTVREHIAVAEQVTTVVSDGNDLLLVGKMGTVFRWAPPLGTTLVASFGGSPTRGAALAGADALVAVVDGDRLVAIDLTTRTRHVRVPDGLFYYVGPPAITAQGETRMLTTDGLLLGHDADGKETQRVPVDPGSVPDAGGGNRSGGTGPSLVVGSAGRMAFARLGQDVGVVTADGKVATAAGAACARPVSVTPAGRRRLAIACASGLVWLVGD